MSPHEIEHWIRLSLAGVPTAPTRALLRHFKTPSALFEAALETPQTLLDDHEISEKALAKLRKAATQNVTSQTDALHKHQISIVPEPEFPPLLSQIGNDTPPFLFVRGAFCETDHHSIGIVGTRHLTEYGRGIAQKWSSELAHTGWTVVSGLARGIDTAAHRGALDGGGRTIAATACGLDIVYPEENRDLMLEIERNGAVISEWCPGTQPVAWHFPARNRIIAGLSRAVIVVEAPKKSGAMITATFASEHDRTVFAVPGNLHKPQSAGPHQLIREGAVLLESIEDLLAYLTVEAAGELTPPRELRREKDKPEKRETISLALDEKSGPLPGEFSAGKSRLLVGTEPDVKSSRPAKPLESALPTRKNGVSSVNFSPNENAMWLALDFEPRHMDDLQNDAGLEPGAANAALVMLEIKGAAKRLPGNLFVKVAS